jgi:uncharacterized Ntn-hydrolase superfamily protein
VSFALPGLGAIASQSMGEPMYGELGLALLRGGLTAREALHALTSVDPHPERRQVAILGFDGQAAAHTGRSCLPAAGQAEGDGVVAVANTVRGPLVWEASVDGFHRASGSLARRLLAALRAGEEAGGDLRGRRSAAVMVVRAATSGRPWHDTVVDLRVDDSAHPLDELGQLLARRARYQRAVRAFEQALDGDPAGAERALDGVYPDAAADPDQVLWRAVVAALAGHEAVARRLLHDLRESAPQFLSVAHGLVDACLVPADLLADVMPPDAQDGLT